VFNFLKKTIECLAFHHLGLYVKEPSAAQYVKHCRRSSIADALMLHHASTRAYVMLVRSTLLRGNHQVDPSLRPSSRCDCLLFSTNKNQLHV
jgi:hypothetical protein